MIDALNKKSKPNLPNIKYTIIKGGGVFKNINYSYL